MSECSMASFSDAHECEEIPIIAANLHRAILPRQSQIWAVIRKDDSLKRIAYSIAATFLGRMCISGDVQELSEPQWKVMDDGIAFYKRIAPVKKRIYLEIWHGEQQLSSSSGLAGGTARGGGRKSLCSVPWIPWSGRDGRICSHTGRLCDSGYLL